MNQRLLEFLSSFYAAVFMLAGGIALIVNPNEVILARFSHDWGFVVTPNFFGALCFLGSLIALISYLIKMSNSRHQQYYILATAAIPLYTVPTAYYLVATRGPAFGIIVYGLFEFSFFIIAKAVWRNW